MTCMPSAEVLSRKVKALLSEAAFVFAEATDESRDFGGDVVVARLKIQHEDAAELVVYAEHELGKLLAANLLGTDNDAGEARAAIHDAVGELTNILAGSLAVEMFGKDVVTRIGIPAVTAEPAYVAQDRLAGCACRVRFVTDEGHGLAVAISAVRAP